MYGYNEVTLNPATMQTIVQEWIDKNFKEAGKVVNVRWLSPDGFVVRLKGDDAPTESKP